MPIGTERLIDLITPEEISGFTEFYQSPERQLSSLFEFRDSNSPVVEAKLLSEDGETTPMASVHARNVAVKMAGRPNWETIKAKTLLIKEAIDVTAVEQEFMENGMGDRAFFFSNIFNNYQRRMDAVRDRRYAMMTEPLSNGNFTIDENDFNATINIGFKPENFMFTNWTSSTADIFGDIDRLHAVSTRRNRPITRFITSTKVARAIIKNEGIQAAFKNATFGAGVPTGYSTAVSGFALNSRLNLVMGTLFGLTGIINDEILTMMKADGTIGEYRVYDENKITFFGGELTSGLGIVLTGVTEEERMWGLNVGDVRPVIRASDGVVTTRWDADNPPRRILQAATVALPIYPGIKNMYIMKVL